jgi:uracil-DNA glycosylase
MLDLPKSWLDKLEPEINKFYFQDLLQSIYRGYQERVIYPPKDDLFNAFKLTPLDKVKVVILGQDPYHGVGQAQGLAFSVPNDIPIPPSLKNIYKELEADLNIEPRTSGDLTKWAKQGVMLLNTTLTVEAGKAGSHHGWGWEIFTDRVIEIISREQTNVVFLLWGRNASNKEPLIDTNKHLIIKSAHPSPLSAYRGFFNSRPFSQTNQWLKANNIKPIDW